jgi:tRNA (guanine37-N1)-methyltransferase
MSAKITFHIVTLFPQSLDSYLNESILKRAVEDGIIRIHFYNPRDFAVPTKKGGTKKVMTYAERRVDDKPYGGGPGMVIEALPVIRAIEAAQKRCSKGKNKKTVHRKNDTTKIFFFSPSGRQFDTMAAKKTAQKYTDIILVCGRYEGIDARVGKAFTMEEISVGPYVLTGGELPAMILIDTIARQVPGVLGDINSLEESRASSTGVTIVASRDVYTRPEIIEYKGKKYRVPKILLSGNHALIEEWKREQNAKVGEKVEKKYAYLIKDL